MSLAMSRNNLPKSEAIVAKTEDTPGKKRVRAVHAVMMRWVLDGNSPDEILRENPGSLQEFVAQSYVRNLYDAVPGTKIALQAAKELRLLIDGNDEDSSVPMIPVTYVQRLIENDNGSVSKEREIQHEVRLALKEDNR